MLSFLTIEVRSNFEKKGVRKTLPKATDKQSVLKMDHLRATLLAPPSVEQRLGAIDPWVVHVLVQPRRTFEDVEVLANSIVVNKWLDPPVVALIDPVEWPQYIAVINSVWGTEYDHAEFTPNYLPPGDSDRMLHAVLIAGERRTRACRHLWSNGCAACREAGRVNGQGECFGVHFPDRQMPVFFRSTTAIQALNTQFAENTHHQVPPHEEAEGYYLFFRFLRQYLPELTVAAFARQVGRREEWIRNALRFCETFEEIQEAVRHGYLPYTVALELDRLKRANFSHDEVLTRMRLYVAKGHSERPKTDEFRRTVSALIRDRQSGQGLLELMDEQQVKIGRRSEFRRTLAQNIRLAILGGVTYLKQVLGALDREEVGRVFALGSIRRIIAELVDLLERINAHQLRILQRTLAKRLRKDIAHFYAIEEAQRKLHINGRH